MKNKNTKVCYYTFFLLTVFFFYACEEFDDPGSVYPPATVYSDPPVISGLVPPDSAYAGAREIIIEGQNFSTVPEENAVFFNKTRGTIKSVSPNAIVLYRPAMVNDTVTITVTTRALSFDRMENYQIKSPGGAFPLSLTSLAEALYALEIDKDENLYISTRRKIYKVLPDGTMSEFLSTPSSMARFTDLKAGPDGYLYFTIQNKKEISRVNLASPGAVETYVTAPKNVERIDFDQNGNIYAGQREGVFCIKTDKSIITTGLYNGTTILELRVFENNLYVLDSKILHRNVINADGTLGASETVINLNDFSEFEDSVTISSFNFDEDGMLFLCLKKHPTHSVFVFENDSIIPYYRESILPTQVDQLTWGNGNYLYLNRGLTVENRAAVRLYRMGTEKKGAPYLGRK